ncbi:arsenate reductase [Escherichia coli]|nr:arsenate reductase [Escherichia coli]EFN4416816.1 arsenate reductase [Escherichia coli]EFN4967990.1 arsenate reductase [Escherichia coli]EFO2361300.1 arsenate reductase [Escherichia coli]PPE88985.1 arsenate reductase [Escherichia coli]
MNSAGIMSLNVIGHVGTRSVHLYVYNFNRKVSPSYEFIKNG